MATGREKYSKTVSQTLDNLQYNEDVIEDRRRHYDDLDITKNLENHVHENFANCTITFMTAGSKAEGLTAPLESDTDKMCIMSNVICVNDPGFFIDQTDLTIFQTEKQEANPGYARLKLIKSGIANVEESFFQEQDGERYISSTFIAEAFRKWLLCSQNQYISQEGPACNILDESVHDNHNIDFVITFHCVCPDLLNAYLNRPRKHGWPTKQILDEVSKADAHVVPVGNKESPESYKEWRICFTKAEIILVRSLNDTQIKLYILLKMVCKSMIKKKFPAITSYVMKNIVLWMVETNPQELFTDKQLLERLIQSLYFLKIRVESGFIPSYMISDRNLLVGRINSTQQQQLVTLLTSLIKAGPYLVLQCPKLHHGLAMIYSQPIEAVTAAMNRNKIEKIFFLIAKKNCQIVNITENAMDQIWDQMFRDPEHIEKIHLLLDLLVPNWRTLLLQGIDIQPIVQQNLKKTLS